jgi:hypothetical protein
MPDSMAKILKREKLLHTGSIAKGTIAEANCDFYKLLLALQSTVKKSAKNSLTKLIVEGNN